MFTGGCNLCCPYCHNPGLVLDPGSFPDIPLDQLLEDLRQRGNFIDGIVVSGGEPTLDPGLPAFLRLVRALSLQIKLDTNGLLPKVIESLLAEGLIDYLAVDLKTSPGRYSELHRFPVPDTGLRETIAVARTAEIAVEFRTTCIPRLVGEQEINELGELLRGAPLWTLQQYIPQHAMVPEWQELSTYRPEQLQKLAQLAAPFVGQVQLRGA